MWSKRPCLSNVKLGVVSGSTQLRSNSRATPATKAHLKCETWDPGSQGPKWIRHVGLVHNLLDISHQNFNDAFLPRGPKRGHPQRFPAGQCLLNMPTRPPGEAPRRPPRSPAGGHPENRHKLPGELQRALAGPQDTTQESPPQRHSRPMLIGFATLSTRDWYKIRGPRRTKNTLLDKLCVAHRVFTKHRLTQPQ